MGYSSTGGFPFNPVGARQYEEFKAALRGEGKKAISLTDDNIRRQFVNRVLVHGGRLMMGSMIDSINKMDLIKSRFLIDSLKMSVNTDSSEYEGRLSFRFATYGRFQDMGAGLTKTDEMEDVLHFLGKRKRSIKRTPRKWYTRNVYGNMNTIINSLMHGYSDHIKAAIKQQLEEANQ
jgi:hypothetical protein